jgi:hypothetical protein
MISTVLTTVLGSGVGMTGVLAVYDRVRNRKFERRKQDSTIKLDEATYAEISSRAEQTNSSSLMAVGAFWQGQFASLASQVASLEDWRRRAKNRWHEHQVYDEGLARQIVELGGHAEPPPSLDPDDVLPGQQAI